MTAETKPDNGTQATAEAIVTKALATHSHVVPDPSRHLRPHLVTAPGSARVEWPRAAPSR
ncbi:MAG: hypothetical protein ACRYGP_23055 [Janthinobacterium lividum]